VTATFKRYVLDSIALLAYLENETGAERVKALLKLAAQSKAQLFVSHISIGELLYIVERERGLAQAQFALNFVEQWPITQIEATRERVFAAAHIKAAHRLSYADAFVVALAIEMDAIILTGDPEFRSVENIAKVEWLPA
jgi:predicted nucleic acid-binding protein